MKKKYMVPQGKVYEITPRDNCNIGPSTKGEEDARANIVIQDTPTEEDNNEKDNSNNPWKEVW